MSKRSQRSFIFLLFICALFFKPCPSYLSKEMIEEKIPKFSITKSILRCPESYLQVCPIFRDNNASANNQSNQTYLSENGQPVSQPSDESPTEQHANNTVPVGENVLMLNTNYESPSPTVSVFSEVISESGNPVTHPREETQPFQPSWNTPITYQISGEIFSCSGRAPDHDDSITNPHSVNQSARNSFIPFQIRGEPFSPSRRPPRHYDEESILSSIDVRDVYHESPATRGTISNGPRRYECPSNTVNLQARQGLDQSNHRRQRGAEESSTVRLRSITQNGRTIHGDTELYLPFARPCDRFQLTCTIDNFLTIVYVTLMDDQALQQRCQESLSPYESTLHRIFFSIKNGQFDDARNHWLRYISRDQSSGSLYGTEREIIHGHVIQSCSTGGIYICKRHSCACSRMSLSTGVIQLSMNESATHEHRCHSEFCRRVFEPQPPAFLTIDVERIKYHLMNVDSIPETVHFNGHTYSLAGITFHVPTGSGHFTAMVVHQSRHQSRNWRYCNSSPLLTLFTRQNDNEFLSFVIYKIEEN